MSFLLHMSEDVDQLLREMSPKNPDTSQERTNMIMINKNVKQGFN